MTATLKMAWGTLFAMLLLVTSATGAFAQYPPGGDAEPDCSSSTVEDGEDTTCGVAAGSFMADTPVEYEITYGALDGETPGQASGATASFAAASATPTFRFAPTADQSTVELAQAPYRRVETGTTTAAADGSASIIVSPREGESVERVAFSGIAPDGQPVTYAGDPIQVVDDETAGGADGGTDGDTDEDGLPATGGQFTVGAALAAVALVGGAALVLVGRRRHENVDA